MLNETRVNLKHLLEDIRDAYTSPLEEVILTELAANALDSKAKVLHFTVDAERKFLRCVDDGNGMKREQLKNYHNIAASTKTRGQGIGFAGVGAKLSLLIADKVVTESKGGHGTKSATEWQLTQTYRAPWKFVPYSGTVQTPRGTSVTIHFTDSRSRLLSEDFVEQAIIRHFYPLLSEQFYNQFLKYFYKVPVSFVINGRHIVLPEAGQEALQHWFKVSLGKTRAAAGVGFLVRAGMGQAGCGRCWAKALLFLRFHQACGFPLSARLLKAVGSGWVLCPKMPRKFPAWWKFRVCRKF